MSTYNDMASKATAPSQAADSVDSDRQATVLSAALVILLGGFVLFGVALAQPAAVHNAAHDARHSFSFPCH